MAILTREEYKKIIPHREPMLLVDEVELNADGSARGSYTVRGDEWFLAGHFPGNPIMPGVIQCEIAAQISAVMFAEDVGGGGKTPSYTGIKGVKFRKRVVPGDTVEFVCRTVRVMKPFYFVESKGFVRGEICMSGEFSFALV